MSNETEYSEYQEGSSSQPVWMYIVLGVLAVVSIAGLGLAWSTSNALATSNEQNAALAADIRSLQRSIDGMSRRVKSGEETASQALGNLDQVSESLKATQARLAKAQKETKQVREEYSAKIAEVETSVKSELAGKASADDITAVKGDVNGVRSDLDATRQHLQMARGELGTLIARNGEEIAQLRKMGQRDYFEFNLARKGTREKVGAVVVELRGTNTKRNQFTVALYVDDLRLEKKNRSVNEPIYFYTSGTRAPLELVVNQVGKDRITGYLSVPKSASASSSGL